MRVAEHWQEYELLDCTNGERLERWGDLLLIRPDPQVIWTSPRQNPLWAKAHARYHRSTSGGGCWENMRAIPKQWHVRYGSLTFLIEPMGFKHTGLFPEQAINWDLLTQTIQGTNKPVHVLNLFAYTGGATLACLAAGARVTHVDASKGMVQRAKENAALSGLQGDRVRWIVDDCIRFAAREIRRGKRYDIILLDPPSYGRGPNGEVWKLEDALDNLCDLCLQLLSDTPLLLLLNSYTTAFSPAVMRYFLAQKCGLGAKILSSEIGLPCTASGLPLPCGATTQLRFA
ncbi:MAG: class I SAM-dependent methyltransferase [Oscillospiraceae bacterium]|nr:class I SAM-dependent methyltransferase [Oscillospiraceae bacterium]